MRNDDEPRRRIGAKRQHESLIAHHKRTAESWEEWDKMPSFWDMGPEKMINSYEQSFEAVLKRLGLPIVGIGIFETEERQLPGGLVIKRRRLPDEILLERQQLADEFIQEHNIGRCYAKPLIDIYLKCDERGVPLRQIDCSAKSLVMKLISKAAPANDYEIARQAAEALFEARQAKSSLKDGNESGALVRALVLASRVGLFVTAEMQLGYLSGRDKSASMAESNIDSKRDRAERKELCWSFYQAALQRGKTKNNAYKITADDFNKIDEEKYKEKCKAEYKEKCKITDNDFNKIYEEEYKKKYKRLSHATVETYMKQKEKEEAMKKEERL